MKNRTMSYVVKEIIKSVKENKPVEISNFTYAGNKYRNSHNSGLEVLKHPNITLDNLLEFYNGFTGKAFPREPNSKDLSNIMDIISATIESESGRLVLELYNYIKKNKSEEKENFNSIW